MILLEIYISLIKVQQWLIMKKTIIEDIDRITELKELLIIGPNLFVLAKTEALLNRDDCLIIKYDPISKISITKDFIEKKLKEKNCKIGRNTRIDINAHGNNLDGKHIIDLDEDNSIFTQDFFEELKNLVRDEPLHIHLWSCYGGAANKVADALGYESILVTHVEGKESSLSKLSDYIMIKSLNNYLTNPSLTVHEQFLHDLPYNFEPTTFSKINKDRRILKFKSLRILRKEELKNLREGLNNSGLDYAKQMLIEESKEFQKIFPDTNIDLKLDDNILKEYLLGIFIHACSSVSKTNEEEIEKFIISLKNLNININDSINHLNPLFSSLIKNNGNIAKILIKSGANINIKNDIGDSPLIWAASNGKPEIVKLLLSHQDIDVNVKNDLGTSPLIFAVKTDKPEIVKLLLAHEDINVNAKNNFGISPLILAVEDCKPEIVKLLLAHEKIKDTKIAISTAKDPEIIQLLKAHEQKKIQQEAVAIGVTLNNTIYLNNNTNYSASIYSKTILLTTPNNINNIQITRKF